jgi:hypothetical protein
LEPQFGDRIRLGVLTEGITAEVVDDVLELTGRAERRRRLLPARAVVYFVLALCLFSSSDSTGPPGYRVVLRTLTEKLRHLPGGLVQRLLTSSALTRARQRLGDKPFQALCERRCRPQATPPERSPSACGWSPGTAPHWTYRTPPRTPPRSGSPAATDQQKRKPPGQTDGLARVRHPRHHRRGLRLDRQIQRAQALPHWFRRLRIRWEMRDDIHEAFLTLGCALICWQRLMRSRGSAG